MPESPGRKAADLAVCDLAVDIGSGQGVVHAVRGVSFEVPAGSRMGVVGESGSGKSMTSYAILRVLPRTGRIVGGRVEVGGQELTGLTEKDMNRVRGRVISLVFQNAKAALNPVFPVGNQIASAYRAHFPASGREARERAVDMLARMGITNARQRASAYPHEFSGGMAQRAMIAMALICEPSILLADEPTTGLDLTIQAQVLDVIDAQVNEFQTSLVMISHDLAVVRRMCTDVVVMYAGEIAESGPLAVVLSQPAHPYTQGLVAAYEAADRPVYIAGRVPSLTRSFKGCPFADRCHMAEPICREHKPELRELADGRRVACHMVRE